MSAQTEAFLEIGVLCSLAKDAVRRGDLASANVCECAASADGTNIMRARMASRMTVTEEDSFGEKSIRTFNVLDVGHEKYTRAIVWLNADGTRPACTACAGPRSAMLASCRHAKAVLRFVKSQRTNTHANSCKLQRLDSSTIVPFADVEAPSANGDL